MQEVLDHALGLGLGVKFRDLGRRSGELTSGGLILVNYRKSVLTQRITIAHECGHWFYGHDWTREHDRVRDEFQADLYAARLLISEVEYAMAERIVGSHPGALAKELGVSARLVELWRVDASRSMRGA